MGWKTMLKFNRIIVNFIRIVIVFYKYDTFYLNYPLPPPPRVSQISSSCCTFTYYLKHEQQCFMQPRTQALSTTCLAGWKTLVQAGHVWDNNWDLWGVGKANVAFKFKTIQGVWIKQHKELYHETKFLVAFIFHKIHHNGYCKGQSC